MNNLSWFLYAVDFLSALDTFLTMIGILSGAIVALIMLSIFACSIEPDEYNNPFVVLVKGKLRHFISLFFVSIILTTIIPSTKTMYLILGSEVTETAIYSETGQRVHQAINKKLDEYLKEGK